MHHEKRTVDGFQPCAQITPRFFSIPTIESMRNIITVKKCGNARAYAIAMSVRWVVLDHTNSRIHYFIQSGTVAGAGVSSPTAGLPMKQPTQFSAPPASRITIGKSVSMNSGKTILPVGLVAARLSMWSTFQYI